jgi:hypothetical protein
MHTKHNGERKRPRGRNNHRWEDNFKMDVRKIGLEGLDASG